jgi:eukaryotic-like serine/threonine-protein kinase
MVHGPGTMVGSNVRLQRLLGQGGMGSVWVADHLGLQTEVAVKFISVELAKTGEAMTRFQREASAAAQLRSPHVVQVFDHGITADGAPYIVMELLEGEELSKRIERLGPLPVPEVVAIVSQVCKALGKAHAQGIVHRDIKPDNIFLTDSDGDIFVKLLDFGIAKRAQDAGLGMTSTGAMVGTPYFMSPEQVLSAKDVDLRSDLWSVAVVAYNALTAALPFTAETLGALCVAISDGSFAAPTQRRPELPPAIDSWFEMAMNRDPQARFASARQLSESFMKAAGLGRPRAAAEGSGANPAIAAGFTPPELALGASVTVSRSSSKAALMALIGVGAGVVIATVVAIVILVGQTSSADPAMVVEPAAATSLSAGHDPAPAASASNEAPLEVPTASSEPTAPSATAPTPVRSRPTSTRPKSKAGGTVGKHGF